MYPACSFCRNREKKHFPNYSLVFQSSGKLLSERGLSPHVTGANRNNCDVHEGFSYAAIYFRIPDSSLLDEERMSHLPPTVSNRAG
ncbi:1-Acylglycerol-3-Phosphate O-Acyltransferase Pnpla3 [Manis pentadactyla]|nr:1-Acylglycerol-3-Phosphate O-Acyltransferase Pnpla3 [Manis pentadactyla]